MHQLPSRCISWFASVSVLFGLVIDCAQPVSVSVLMYLVKQVFSSAHKAPLRQQVRYLKKNQLNGCIYCARIEVRFCVSICIFVPSKANNLSVSVACTGPRSPLCDSVCTFVPSKASKLSASAACAGPRSPLCKRHRTSMW